MKHRTLLAVAAGALLLVACKDDDNVAAVDTSVVGTANTLIANRTTEQATPANLDMLAITEDGTDDTSLPIAIN